MKTIIKRILRELLMFLITTAASAYIFGSLYVRIDNWETYRRSLMIATVFYVVMRLLPGFAAPWIIKTLLLKRFKRSLKITFVEILIYALSGVIATYLVLIIVSGITNLDMLGSARAVYVQLFIGLIMTLLITASIYAVVFYREMMKKVIEAQQARELAVQSEVKALRAQINPHFLFNTLNSISSLIPSEPDKADRVTQKLADIFRYALVASEKEFVTLEEEFRFINNYLEIEKIRFEERLKIEMLIQPDTLTVTVPSLILQPIVENALKHGISKNIHGGTLTLHSEIINAVLQLTVIDDGAGFDSNRTDSDGLGIGLRNVDQRLKKIYGPDYGLHIASGSAKGAQVILTLPCKR